MTYETFAARLRQVIGETPFTKWATDNGFKPSTVNEWLNHGRIPRKDGVKLLVDATGIPEHWWLHGDGPPPSSIRLAAHQTGINYQTGHEPTKLIFKSPEPTSTPDALDTDLFIYVSIAVQKMLEKTGKNIDLAKRNKLILLIYEYCKMKGECDDEIISKFLNVAG